MNEIVEKLLNDYHEWLKGRVSITDLNGACEITTPFVDRHNDRLQIYVEQDGDGFRLSDDSYIISDLASSGCPTATPHRKKLLQGILHGFGVSVEDEELFVHATEKNFPVKKHSLIQAMLAVNDMFLTASPHVANLFFEEVKSFLEKNDIRYSPDVEFTGKSGFKHKFDYVIPKSKHHPERIIKAINHPTKNDITSLLFAWTDTKDARPEKASAFAVINDQHKTPNRDILKSLRQYGIIPVPWSEHDKSLPALVA